MTIAQRLRSWTRAIRWTWDSNRQVPYHFDEVWTRTGRRRHFQRWVEYRAAKVRSALSALGARTPNGWQPEQLICLADVLVDRCYEHAGFVADPETIILDVGCCFGDYALLSAIAAPPHRVVAFDPDPDNVARTKELLAVNNLQDRAEVLEMALGDRDGVVRLGRMSKWMLAVGSSQDGHDVPIRRLDSLSLGGRIGLIKIDVEGMEADVLAGARGILMRDHPKVVVEIHGGAAYDRTAALLRESSYQLVFAESDKKDATYGFTRNEFWASTRSTDR